MTNLLFTERLPVDYRDLYAQQTPAVALLSARMPKLMATEGLHVLRNMFVGSTAISNDDIDETIVAVTRSLLKAAEA
jgi:glutamate-1-semialdehyde 2,1-aminomutase